jgi:hypothetical protein
MSGGGSHRRPTTTASFATYFFWKRFVAQGLFLDCTQPASHHLSSMSFGSHEVILYPCLKLFGIGLPIIFLFNAYSVISFHILTKGLSAEFPQDRRLFPDSPVTFLELVLIQLIFFLVWAISIGMVSV